jgi:3D (Asp-Asp-Asp) domain-containing protein
MGKKILLSSLLYLLIFALIPKIPEQTAVASTMGFPFISANSYYESPSYINSGKSIQAISSNYPYEEKIENYKERYFWISAYNSFEYQTDNTPCIPASGKNICGRNNVIACPRQYPLGTKFVIDNKQYICEDRLSEANDYKIDIFYDKDLQGALKWGLQYKLVKIIE